MGDAHILMATSYINFDGIHTHFQKTFIGIGCMMIVLTGFSLSMRIWSKKLKSTGFGLDDWLALLALPFYYAELGVHFWCEYPICEVKVAITSSIDAPLQVITLEVLDIM